VSVKDVAYGLTGEDGRYTFRVPDGRKYTAAATKQGYWDASVDFTSIAYLYLEIKPEEAELGGTFQFRAYDNRHNPVDAEYTVTGPNGSIFHSNGSFTPSGAGKYSVSATRAGYIPSVGNFSVKPHPLEMSIAIARDRILVNTTSHGLPAANIPLIVEKTPAKNG